MKTLKKYKIPILIGVLFLVIAVAYSYRDKIPFYAKKKPQTDPILITSSNNGETRLSKGSRGEEVVELQRMLNEKHRSTPPQIIPLLLEDGIFGNRTETMLKKWTGKTSVTIKELQKALE